MPKFKSREILSSDSDSSDDDLPSEKSKSVSKKPAKAEKKKASVEKPKKDKKKERGREVEKPKKEKRKIEKRPISPMSEPDSPPRKKKEVERPAKKKPAGADEPSGGVDLSSMTLIGPKRYIGPMEFKGKHYLNIREYYEDSTGMKPTKKGVALNQAEWRTLKSMFYDVDEKIINAEAEDYNPLELSDKKQIRVTKFKGKFLLIDVREFYHKDGEKMPGKKGIALKQDQYNKIKDMQEEIDGWFY